ncbi:sigma factor-like helix-turn-helix DNA-binding protein [Ectobacillus polymachus]|uniref:sigma factor-like helix-turn-helix DNA-binding protein n=1 Tax=Ectobacillus polymachus TaxID=1508806 RepID=UPI003A83B306
MRTGERSLYHLENLLYTEIARSLHISKSAIQIMIKRAEKKIEKQVKESIFCSKIKVKVQ